MWTHCYWYRFDVDSLIVYVFHCFILIECDHPSTSPPPSPPTKRFDKQLLSTHTTTECPPKKKHTHIVIRLLSLAIPSLNTNTHTHTSSASNTRGALEEQGSKEQHNHEHTQPGIEEKIFTDDELLTLIDPILTMDDYSQDGFIDYPEFVRAQQKAAQTSAREAEQALQQQQHQPPPAQP